jgi:gliding motility-associated-like protein
VIVKNVEVNNKGEVSFTWIWNNDADLDEIKIQKSTDGKTWKDIGSIPSTNFPGELTYTDKTGIGTDTVHYAIYSRDICDKVQLFPFYTLNIKGNVQDNRSNLLNWTTHFLPGVQKTDYELYRVINGLESKIWEAQNKNEFVDPFDPLNPDNANICYFVVAYVYDTLPNGKPVRVRSKSNTVCVSQTATIFTPNAFAPRGVNQEFRPIISFNEQLASFSMLIFDRFGAKVFETTDLTVGWNGKLNNTGREMSQDTYVYYIKAIQKNGKTDEAKGTVILLR